MGCDGLIGALVSWAMFSAGILPCLPLPMIQHLFWGQALPFADRAPLARANGGTSCFRHEEDDRLAGGLQKVLSLLQRGCLSSRANIAYRKQLSYQCNANPIEMEARTGPDHNNFNRAHGKVTNNAIVEYIILDRSLTWATKTINASQVASKRLGSRRSPRSPFVKLSS